jgi:hypothetical protein
MWLFKKAVAGTNPKFQVAGFMGRLNAFSCLAVRAFEKVRLCRCLYQCPGMVMTEKQINFPKCLLYNCLCYYIFAVSVDFPMIS